jgi:nuclear pore complex protein Nup85
MVTHAIELLTARSDQADFLLHKEHDDIGGLSMEELHRLVYAQVLTSHFLTWQVSANCLNHGMLIKSIVIMTDYARRVSFNISSRSVHNISYLRSSNPS